MLIILATEGIKVVNDALRQRRRARGEIEG
jgi:hypothetical protein